VPTPSGIAEANSSTRPRLTASSTSLRVRADPPEADVVGQAHRGHAVMVSDQHQAGGQCVRRPCGRIHTADQDLPRLQGFQTCQEAKQGGLARPGWAGDDDQRARRNGHVDHRRELTAERGPGGDYLDRGHGDRRCDAACLRQRREGTLGAPIAARPPAKAGSAAPPAKVGPPRRRSSPW
jgi:hypothetical protein